MTGDEYFLFSDFSDFSNIFEITEKAEARICETAVGVLNVIYVNSLFLLLILPFLKNSSIAPLKRD